MGSQTQHPYLCILLYTEGQNLMACKLISSAGNSNGFHSNEVVVVVDTAEIMVVATATTVAGAPLVVAVLVVAG